MRVRQRVSGFVASCLVLAVAATPLTLGAGFAHAAPAQGRLSILGASQVVRAGQLRGSLSNVPRGPRGPHSQLSAVTIGLEKSMATLVSIAAASLSWARGGALSLLSAGAALWLLGFIRRSSRTRGQPRAGALAR